MSFKHGKVVTAATRPYLQLAGMCPCLPALRLQTIPVGTRSNPSTIHRIWAIEGGAGKAGDDDCRVSVVLALPEGRHPIDEIADRAGRQVDLA
ncbi:MAG: hypothetical protein QOD90_5630 [Mycobacterium sp.]|jgi:hypothetical protein|nr:hypothetical protein [Mycobacterium sp.]